MTNLTTSPTSLALLEARVAEYVAPPGLTFKHRVAHFLDWVADRVPRVFVPYDTIVRVAMHLPDAAAVPDDARRHLLHQLSAIRNLLMHTYQRGLLVDGANGGMRVMVAVEPEIDGPDPFKEPTR